MFATGETVGLAEWIIDDTCLVYFLNRDFETGDKNKMQSLKFQKSKHDRVLITEPK